MPSLPTARPSRPLKSLAKFSQAHKRRPNARAEVRQGIGLHVTQLGSLACPANKPCSLKFPKISCEFLGADGVDTPKEFVVALRTTGEERTQNQQLPLSTDDGNCKGKRASGNRRNIGYSGNRDRLRLSRQGTYLVVR